MLIFLILITRSSIALRDPVEQVRRYTRQIEFNFVAWTADALGVKVGQFSLGVSHYLKATDRDNLVREFFNLVGEIHQVEGEVEVIYGDASIADPDEQAIPYLSALMRLRARRSEIQPMVEEIMQEQVSTVLTDLGLGLGGVPIPAVEFHFTETPYALIVSPRAIIRQDANIDLETDLTLEERIELERRIEQGLDVSALVVPIGGIGIYPTMVMQSTAFVWVMETIVHEWTHNYLTLRPLGINYDTSPELRTMNETVATIIGKEIGKMVLQRYYPEFAPQPAPEVPAEPEPEGPPAFDFRAEMRQTRVTVDALLAEGKIHQAEAYMEERRQLFWDNGYHIRRLNQAYFAFHGAYADQPGGASGDDPVGAAVRALRDQIDDPISFLRTMSWMNDIGDLQRKLIEISSDPAE